MADKIDRRASALQPLVPVELRPVLTKEEWRVKRQARRERQRAQNLLRAAHMHAAQATCDWRL